MSSYNNNSHWVCRDGRYNRSRRLGSPGLSVKGPAWLWSSLRSRQGKGLRTCPSRVDFASVGTSTFPLSHCHPGLHKPKFLFSKFWRGRWEARVGRVHQCASACTVRRAMKTLPPPPRHSGSSIVRPEKGGERVKDDG